MEENKKYYITTPIYYPSGDFHVGTCYCTLMADTLARYKRLRGYDVFFMTGTDEHGQKIEEKAKARGITPKEFVDEFVAKAKDLWKVLDISYDKYMRTTYDHHVKAVQQIFEKLLAKGDIYKGEYTGLYCTPCESFWTESQLVDGKCPDCGREVQPKCEEAYFFKLSKYQDQLEEYIESHPEFIQPAARKNEMINNFIKPGLEDLCVSRSSFTWGIPVPFDDKHVIYVWVDALSNYITSLGYGSEDDSKLKRYWPADLHLVGKEIVRFHTIIWPALLMALDLELPKKVYGHGWLVINGDKISKSLGNYKDPREYIDAYGIDALRYYALREVPFGSDGNFSEGLLISRINADLVNTYGNLVNRTISMANKYFDGVVSNKNVISDIDGDLLDSLSELPNLVDDRMEKLEVNNALDKIFEVLRKTNKYVDLTEPWVLAKDENLHDRLETVLYHLLDSIRICSILLQPFIPGTCCKVFEQLGVSNTSFSDIDDFGIFEVGNPEILFHRIDK